MVVFIFCIMQLREIIKEKSEILLFILKIFLVYILWLFLKSTIFRPNGPVDEWLIRNLINATALVLQTLGFEVFQTFNRVGIDGTHGITIAFNCNGLSLMAVYSGFLIAYPLNLKTRLIALLSGNLIINALNVLRLVLLSIIVHLSPDSLAFHHKYTFTIVVYSAIVILWYYFLRISGKK